MYYLAFDVSKAKVDGVLTNLRGKETFFQIENSEEALSLWLQEASLPKKIAVGSESTANYHLALQKMFVEAGYRFSLINPIATKQFTRATVRKRKTDKTDSVVIAKLLAQGEGREVMREDLDTSLKTRQRTWARIGQEWQRMRRMQENLAEYGTSDESLSAITSIERSIHTELLLFEKELKKRYGTDPTILLLSSVPGIGFKLALTIMTEIGDIRRFSHASQIVALAGLDPKIRQSGHCLNSMGRLTKRGSPRLRWAFFTAANVARMHDGELKAHYRKKIGEGKRHTVAVCSVSRKLIHRVYAVWSRQTPYVKR